MRSDRLLLRIAGGDVGNVRFDDLIRELVNLQYDGAQAKRYQVRQVAALVHRYDLTLEEQ